ncbi:DUF4232 domain-containing protein [Rothia kristinae]|uniref:DUF4232 domain-containing protein n=1 Tax=Rothia kristinae TaxID=37923 RepID=UPI001CD56282|nr:DUF4232 domain-containing protein [Rothia kristinae]MCA1169879.1 DUF4232 domain-containing protein [Rothia kristinae]MCT1356349.1 DUF4232 domain-containing protein [Rothia kristinae]MCT1393558.1 DUF4232 domain-containing protein [Rothia kristinae]MCT1505232.1 DUF4232 domain-containing protein [Rothia kristinae]MCT2039077.1 DUF4232 domain-containing protein [Rothia kristinae]
MNAPFTSRPRAAVALIAAGLLLGGCSAEDATGGSAGSSAPTASAHPTGTVAAAPTGSGSQAAAPSSSGSPTTAAQAPTASATPAPAASPTASAHLSAAPAPSVSAAPETAEASGRCATGDLNVQVSSTGGAAGSATYAVRFTNSSDRDCTLSGYPEVSFIDDSGAMLGAPAIPASEQTGEATRLRPGRSAQAILRSTQPELYGQQCSRTSAAGLRVHAPDSEGSLDVALSLPACADAQVQQLSIGPIDARG